MSGGGRRFGGKLESGGRETRHNSGENRYPTAGKARQKQRSTDDDDYQNAALDLGRGGWQPRLDRNHYHLVGFGIVAAGRAAAETAAIPEWRDDVTTSAERRSVQRPRSTDMTTAAAGVAAAGGCGGPTTSRPSQRGTVPWLSQRSGGDTDARTARRYRLTAIDRSRCIFYYPTGGREGRKATAIPSDATHSRE